jgi:quercetin dioxygenase-like cupin family protein
VPIRPRRVRTILLTVLALVLTAAASAYAATTLRGAKDAPVVRTALAQDVDPAGARGQTLGLSRVTVEPGAELALHRHPGTQIAYIQRGTLTYWVVRGRPVEVRSGSPEASGGARLIRRIAAGQSGKVRAGQWVVELPGTIHHAANRGDVEIEILIASLFKDGKPAAIPVPER